MAEAPKAFGKTPPRSLETFGVAGLLGEKAKVFYSSLFSTRHIGQVTDLIAAKLQGEGLDELKLRALLLFGTFEVFRSQADGGENTAKQRLAEPLVVECGLDEDKIAVGVSFTTDEERFPRLEGLIERIEGGNSEGIFEELLTQIHRHSHWTVVRAQPGIRRVEIVALLGMPGKIDAELLQGKGPIQLVEIPRDQKAEPPKVKAYLELGDLDYNALLKDDAAAKKESPPPATGEVLMHGLKELDDAVKVRATRLLEAIAKVGGATENADGSTRVRGQGADQDGVFKVTSGGAIQAADGALIIKGDAAAGPGQGYHVHGGAPAGAPGEGAPTAGAPPAGAAPAPEGYDADTSNRLKEVLEKVKSAWPFRFGRGKEASEPAPESAAAAPAEAPAAVASTEAPAPAAAKIAEPAKAAETAPAAESEADAEAAVPPPAQPIKISTADIAKEAQKLTTEIENGIEKTVSKAQGEANDVKKEMGSTRAKRWVDGLMSELVAEKARLAEASKALNTSIRQKEIEFRTKETILTEELKRRDDLIRQKTNALGRLKDQLSQAAMSAERLKASKGGAGDDAHYKQKYGLVQKMLNSAKEENSELTEKIEDLKNQLMSAQLSSSKQKGPSMTDFSALQAKYERSLRQADEFKKTNQQLLDKLAEAKKERVQGGAEETKKRLEAAMKMANNYQRDSEKLQVRIEEMQREHMRLQAELNKAQHELKSARVGSKAGSAPAEGTATAAAKPAASTAAAAKPVSSKPAGAKPGVSGSTVIGGKPAAAGVKPAQTVAGTKPAATAKAAQPVTGAKPAAPAKPAQPAAAQPAQPAQPTAGAKPAQPAAAKPGTGGKSNPPKAA